MCRYQKVQVLISLENWDAKNLSSKTKIFIRSLSCNLTNIFLTVPLNSVGLRAGSSTGSLNFSLDLSYSQTEELQQLDFWPQLLEFSDSSFFLFFSFIIYFRINNNNCYHCLCITDIKQHEKMCLFPGLESYFSLHIKALWGAISGGLPLQKHPFWVVLGTLWLLSLSLCRNIGARGVFPKYTTSACTERSLLALAQGATPSYSTAAQK